jgi:hypothetical protein
LAFPALNNKKKADELSDVASFVMGSLELVNISPLLQKEPQSFNQVTKLLEGLDEDNVRLIDRLKNTDKESAEDFCESCGNVIKGGLFGFFVSLIRLLIRNVDCVIIWCVIIVWFLRNGAFQ